MFRRSLLLLVLLAIVCARSMAQEMPGCDCDRDDILNAIESADNIFSGQIIKSSMYTAGNQLIRIWVGSIQVIRGEHDLSEAITTTLPQACGIPAHIGSHLLFATSENDAIVTRCSGSALPNGPYWAYLAPALTTIELWDSDQEAVRRALRRFSPYETMDDLRNYFELLETLDPDGKVEFSSDRVRYRKMTFNFSDPVYSIQWEQ